MTMISENELIAQITVLERRVLLMWIDEGLVKPQGDAGSYQFDDLDRSRVALACDLHYRMGLEHASLPIILSLIDQLHDARHCLRALSRAVAEQPEHIQSDIAGRVGRPSTRQP